MKYTLYNDLSIKTLFTNLHTVLHKQTQRLLFYIINCNDYRSLETPPLYIQHSGNCQEPCAGIVKAATTLRLGANFTNFFLKILLNKKYVCAFSIFTVNLKKKFSENILAETAFSLTLLAKINYRRFS
jgi:hypothetical protein